MKKLVLQIYSNPKYSKVFEWGRLISITGSAQIMVQLISFVCGILVIRMLPTQEYALYTLANAMLGTMILLADSGVSTGVMAQGAKVWQNDAKLGAVLVTGLDLRKKFAIGSLIIATPALLYLLRHHGASWLVSILIIVSLIPAFFTGLSGTLLEIVFKLRQNIVPLQKIQVMNNAGRLALLSALLLIFPWTFIAILAAGIPQIWANIRLRKLSASYADWTQKPDPVVRKEILYIVKRVIPGAIYYCLSGQITIWLISIFGTSKALAQMG
ncbi:MAG: polysaccharide biosynthesis protein, partial [Bacteroidota bacterium]